MITYIYVISDGSSVKIGVSKNVEKRIKQLSTGNSNKIKLVEKFAVPDTKAYMLEKLCHEKASHHYPKKGEWFKDASAWYIVVIVNEICEKYIIP